MKYRVPVLAALLLVACAQSTPPEPRHGMSEELHLVPYPGDPPWKEITNEWKPELKLHTSEWIPSDQDPPDVRDILTIQTFHAMRGTDPSAFLHGVMDLSSKACQRTRVNGPKQQTEEGYRVAYAQIYCAEQKGAGKDVDILLKAIRGNDALYVVQREFRRPTQPGAEPGVQRFSERTEAEKTTNAMATANRYLEDGVALCPLFGPSARCAALIDARRR